ncbi:unnamed protein product [Durusdinium trenchii]|uniref:Uncharacterized protein n=1 Tax=Durusdinium trenchii TaxID=1381693 RepID=A0ABP0IKB6_9DINO
MALFKKYPGKKKDGDDGDRRAEEDDLFLPRESAVFRLLKGGSKHFGSYAFRSAFFSHCLDTNVLKALMCAQIPAPHWQRRVSGVACASSLEQEVNLLDWRALDAEAFVAFRGCRCASLIFEAHALEEPECPLLPDELELLERTNYGLAYTSKVVRTKLASLLLPQPSYKDVAGEHCLADSYPSAGDEDGLLLLDLWVLPSQEDPRAMAWRLPMAYGLVPAAAAKDHRKYKAQVAAAVNSAAVYGCDALLIAAKMGLPGTSKGEVISPEEAAVIWADVLRSAKGTAFKQIAFCLGRDASHHRRRLGRALAAAFGLGTPLTQ